MQELMERREVADIAVPHGNGDMLPAGTSVQRTQGRYTTAIQVQRPRSLPLVEAAALQEAALLGPDAFYGWGAGKDKIEGPSKELAMALVRCYGNCAVDMANVQETREAWIFTASFIDLETGFTMTRQFRQSKTWVVYGKFDEARKDDIRFQIGQSKAIRNVVLNSVPGWLVRRALDKAKGGVREQLEKAIEKHGIATVQQRAIAKLGTLEVPEARVLLTMGRKAVAALTIEDLVILQGNIAALESGADTADELFPAGAASKADALNDKIAGAAPAPGSDATDPANIDREAAETFGGEGVAKPEPAAASPAHDLTKLLANQAGCTIEEADARLVSACKVYGKPLAKLKPDQLADLRRRVESGEITV